ncbi:MAG: flavin reductase [Rickettsiaceae bacterium]|nr:MAG: flavin reductase [Rickettsiaceae bacterium]
MAKVINEKEFKESLSRFPTGVSVVTTISGAKLVGFTANSFTSVSLIPPMVSFCLDNQAGCMDHFSNSDVFAVSILAANQEEISKHFSSGQQNKFTNINYEIGTDTRCPLIGGAICYIECSKVHEFAGGDHTIFLGKVISTKINNNLNPLIYFAHKYFKLEQ